MEQPVSLPLYIRCLEVYNRKNKTNFCKPTFSNSNTVHVKKQTKTMFQIMISRQIRRRLEKKAVMYNRETISKIFPKLEQKKQLNSVEEKIVSFSDDKNFQKTKKKRKMIVIISENNNIQEKKKDTRNNMMYFTLGILYFFNFMSVRYQIQRSLGMRLFHVLDFFFYFFFTKFIIRNVNLVNVFRNIFKERRFI